MENPRKESDEAVLRLGFRPPYDWGAMLGFLSARAVEGVEEVVGESYRRTFTERGEVGTITVSHAPELSSLAVRIRGSEVSTPALVARVQRLFDLDADVAAVGDALSSDALLAPLLRARPGLRVPGAWDGFELAVRAVLGQQVTLGAGRKLAHRLVAICAAGADRVADDRGLGALFPSPDRLLAADLTALGMPAARRATLVALADAAVADPQLFTRRMTLSEAVACFRSIRGIGEWTAQYIALRALRHADAFPAGDVALARAVGVLAGVRPSAVELALRAEAWRPWRAYAAQHLWTAL